MTAPYNMMKLLNVFLVQIAFLAVISSKMLVSSSNQTNDDVDGNRAEPTTVTAIYTMVEEQQSVMPATLENIMSNSSTIVNETENQNTLRDRTHVSYYPNYKERPPKNDQEAELGLPSQTAISGAAGSDIVKPTKYHYYPHNQHIYLLPECAVQQVCNVVYIRLNYTQPLCACPSRYREPCSASLNSDDLHTTELSTDPKGKVLTLIKTCEPVADMRLCRNPQDWSLLTLQNIRTGKSHYLVICRCPETSILEGPLSHDQPTYASVPGIRVYGMICVNDPKQTTTSSESINLVKRKAQPPVEHTRSTRIGALSNDLPWKKIDEIVKNHLMD